MNSQYQHSFGPQITNNKQFNKESNNQPSSMNIHFQQQNNKVIFCQLHQNQHIKYICVDKNCPQKGVICDSCLQDHQNHPIYTFDQFIGMYKDSILVQNSLQKLDSQIDILTQVQQNIQKQVQSLNQQIQDLLDDFNQKTKAIGKKDQSLFVNTRDSEQRIYTWLEQLQYKQITNYDDAQYIVQNLLLRSELKQPENSQNPNNIKAPYFEINNLNLIDNNLKITKILSKQEQIQVNIQQNSQKFLSDLQKYFDTLYTQIKNTSEKNQNNFSNKQYIDRIEANLQKTQETQLHNLRNNGMNTEQYNQKFQNKDTYIFTDSNKKNYIESKHTISSNDYSLKKPENNQPQYIKNQYIQEQEIHTQHIINKQQIIQNEEQKTIQNTNIENNKIQNNKKPIFSNIPKIENIEKQYQETIQNTSHDDQHPNISIPNKQPQQQQSQDPNSIIYAQNQQSNQFQFGNNNFNKKQEEVKHDSEDDEQPEQDQQNFKNKSFTNQQIQQQTQYQQQNPHTPTNKTQSSVGKLMGSVSPGNMAQKNLFSNQQMNFNEDPDFGENSNPRSRMYDRAVASKSRSRSPVLSPRRSTNRSAWIPDNQKVKTKYKTSYYAHEQSVNCMTFIDSDKIATGSSDSTIRIYDKTEAILLLVLEGHQASIECIKYYQNPKILASGSADQTVIIWKPNPQWQQVQILTGHLGIVQSLTFLSGEILYTGSQQQLKVWNLESQEEIQQNPIKTIEIQANINCMMLHQHNKCLIIGAGKRLNVYDNKKFLKFKDLDAHQGQITQLLQVKRKADSPFIVSSSKDGTIKLWEGSTMVLFRTIRETQPIQSITYIKEQDQLVCALTANSQDTQGKITFWKLDNLKKQYEIKQNKHNPNQLLYDSYNELIFVCYQNGQLEYHTQDPQNLK